MKPSSVNRANRDEGALIISPMADLTALRDVLGDLPQSYLASLLDDAGSNVETAIAMHFSGGGVVPSCFVNEEADGSGTPTINSTATDREQLIEMGFSGSQVDDVLQQVAGSADVLQTAASVLAAQDGEAEKLQAKLDKAPRLPVTSLCRFLSMLLFTAGGSEEAVAVAKSREAGPARSG